MVAGGISLVRVRDGLARGEMFAAAVLPGDTVLYPDPEIPRRVLDLRMGAGIGLGRRVGLSLDGLSETVWLNMDQHVRVVEMVGGGGNALVGRTA